MPIPASRNLLTPNRQPPITINAMKDSVESRLGLFFAFAIIALLIILEFAGGLDFVKPHYLLHALFKNVQELKTGDFVKMAGVQIGRVEGIALTTNGLADVTM